MMKLLSRSDKKLITKILLDCVMYSFSLVVLQIWLDIGAWKSIGVFAFTSIIQAAHNALEIWSRR